ncbi:MAG: group III truncated hemoglobin [Pseudomonadales bacterium]|nr:group III truncated hemoglobin [Pseudomonadales bacterium]
MRDLPDIIRSEDLETLISEFYKKAMSDSIIGFFFTEIAKLDLAEHIPKIVSFWEMQLFGRRHFKGNAYLTHKLLNEKARLTTHHFQRWTYLFHQVVDKFFYGPNADLIKRNSKLIAKKMTVALESEHPSNGYRPQSGLHIVN